MERARAYHRRLIWPDLMEQDAASDLRPGAERSLLLSALSHLFLALIISLFLVGGFMSALRDEEFNSGFAIAITWLAVAMLVSWLLSFGPSPVVFPPDDEEVSWTS